MYGTLSKKYNVNSRIRNICVSEYYTKMYTGTAVLDFIKFVDTAIAFPKLRLITIPLSILFIYLLFYTLFAYIKTFFYDFIKFNYKMTLLYLISLNLIYL